MLIIIIINRSVFCRKQKEWLHAHGKNCHSIRNQMLNAHGLLGRPFHKTCAYDNINYREFDDEIIEFNFLNAIWFCSSDVYFVMYLNIIDYLSHKYLIWIVIIN